MDVTMITKTFFSPEFFNVLRDEKIEAGTKSSEETIYMLLKNLIEYENPSDPDSTLVDVDRVVELLSQSKLFKTEDEVRVKSAELVSKIQTMKPAVRQAKPGVYVVIGQKGRGKSSWLRALLSDPRLQSNAILLNHDEPKLVSDTVGTSSGLSELLECMDIIQDIPELNVVALDGVRTIQYESSGNALSGGVNSGFFRFLTDAGNAAVDAGVVCLFTYNPNTEKDEAYAVVAAMVDGSVQGIIDMNDSVIRSRYHKRESYPLDDSYAILFDDNSDSQNDNINIQQMDITEL